MFTGIVHSFQKVSRIEITPGGAGSISVELSPELLDGLAIGASVAVNGVCLTVCRIHDSCADFDLVLSTCRKTNISHLQPGDNVNIERSMKHGDEIGGHELSGHVDCTAELARLEEPPGNCCLTFKLQPRWIRYISPQGYIAINGVSLTVSDIDRDRGEFSVWLIPETLRRTNLRGLVVGGRVNIEIHKDTQVLVDAVESAVERVLVRAMAEGNLSGNLVHELLSSPPVAGLTTRQQSVETGETNDDK